MRGKSFVFSGFLLLCAAISCAGGQEPGQNAQAPAVQKPAALEVRFTKAEAYLKDGRVFFGLLVGLEGDAVVLKSGKKDVQAPFNDLLRVVFERERKMAPYWVKGFILWPYFYYLLARRAKSQPTAFYRDTYEEPWFSVWPYLIYVSAGGGLGYLLGQLTSSPKIVFDFSGREEKRLSEWDRLKLYVLGEKAGRVKKWHLAMQAGHVFTRTSDRYEGLMRTAGYEYVSSTSYLENEYAEPATRLNLLRGIRLTYSLTPDFEVGAALAFVGEPTKSGEKYDTAENFVAVQKLSATGFYAVGNYQPFRRQLPKSLVWNVGLGLGLANVDFSLRYGSRSYYPYYSFDIKAEHAFAKTLFSALADTELNVFFSNDFSLGLRADFVFVPSRQVPAMPEAEFPGQKLPLGNASIGLTLGWHF